MKYFALLTTYGEKVLAEATALGTKIELTQMAVGDGGGSLPAPDTKQTKLINEKRRAAINTLFIDSVNTNQIIAEQVIPENEGGWWIREIGLFDKSGLLVAVANCPETYKPLLAEGSGRTQTIRMILIVSHTEAVTLKVDPAIVLATRGYVDDSVKQAIEVHAKSRNHPDATTSAKGFVQLADALSADNTKAVTPKLATEVNQRAVNAQTSANTANTAATDANNNANGRVPSGRKVNNKPLTADINLTAGDVGAYTKAETDTKVADAKKAGTDAQATANAANTAATNANNNANGRVPSGRKVNNKPLTADISLNASDVGALTEARANTLYAPLSSSINLYRFKPRLLVTLTSTADQTINLPESVTGKFIVFHKVNGGLKEYSGSVLVPENDCILTPHFHGDSSAGIYISNVGKTLKIANQRYFDAKAIYVLE